MNLLTDFLAYVPGGLNAPRVALVTAPTVEPLTLDQAKLHLRIDVADEDDYITGLITAARQVFEQLTSRSLVSTAWRSYWDRWPRVGTYSGACISREIELPVGPLIAVQSVKYLDTAGAEQTVSPSDYTVEAGIDANRLGRLRINPAASIPDLGDYPAALRVAFTAGHGVAATDVPAEITAALRLLIVHLYENRSPVVIDARMEALPWSLQSLIELKQLRSLV